MSTVSTGASQKEATEDAVSPLNKGEKEAYPRVTLRLTGDLGDAIEELKEVTFAATPSDVIRRAIIVYHTLVRQKLLGNEAYIEKKEGDSVRKVPLFL